MDQTNDCDSRVSCVIEEEPVTPEQLAAFLDGRLEGDEQARVEAYLADNPSARHELIKASRINASFPPRAEPRPRLIGILGGLAAAAAIAVVALQPGPAVSRASVAVERRSPLTEVGSVELISPQVSGKTVRDPIQLSWHPIAGATYRVVLSDSAGGTLFEKSTGDTTVSVVRSTLESVSGKIYWTVDAQTSDGSSVTSGISELHPDSH